MATFRKRGSRWQAIVRKRGVADTASFNSKPEAQSWATQREAAIDRGEMPAIGGTMSLADLIDYYIRALDTPGRPPSLPNGSHKLRCLMTCRRAMGNKQASNISVQDILDFEQLRRSEGAGPSTILADLSFLHTALSHGGTIAGVPTEVSLAALSAARKSLRHTRRIAPAVERDRRPTEAELEAIVRYLRDLGHGTGDLLADVVLFACCTTMRKSEIEGLRWIDLNIDRKTIMVRARKHPDQRLKKGNDSEVPLLCGPFKFKGQAVDPYEIIARQPRVTDNIFGREGFSTLNLRWNEALRANRVKDLRFHDLRHHAVSLLFENGLQIQEVALLSGHRDWKMLKRYAQIDPASLHKRVAAA